MDFSTIKGVTLPGNLEVKKMQHGNDVLWEAGEPDYSLLPFFVENRTSSSGYVTVKRDNTYALSLTIYKSTDNVNWTSAGTTTTSGLNITLPANGRVYLRCTADSWYYKNANNNVGINKISFNKSVNIGGNIMSLLYGENFVGQTSFPSGSSNNFNGLFNGATNLIDASKLVLPATTLTEYCYFNMFYQATDLTTPPPVLPATKLADSCYTQMFDYCTNLTTAPELPATTLVTRCYSFMFYNCTSLTTAPELPAVTLVSYCYTYMFGSCSNLNYIKAMFTTTPSNTYTSGWVDAVAATGTFVKNKFATWTNTGINAVPTGWTVIREVPEAETLPFYVQNDTSTSGTVKIQKANTNSPGFSIFTSTDNENWTNSGTPSTNGINISIPANGRVYFRVQTSCWCSPSNYQYFTYFPGATVNFSIGGNIMSLVYGHTNYDNYDTFSSTHVFERLFYNNSRLISAEELLLPAKTLTDYCYAIMFNSCTNLTKAPRSISATTLAQYCCQSMFNGCNSLTTTPVLPAETLAPYCYTYMFSGSSSTTPVPITTAPALPATTLAEGCYLGMFQNCTYLTTAPVLPARTLVTKCYEQMFYYCKSLNYIKAMFTTTPSTSYTKYWVTSVKSSGTFVKNASATWSVTGTSGVPSGWTVQTAAS